jgi:superfamily II DNA/RNA helicase
MFSATFESDIRKVAEVFLNEYLIISSDSDRSSNKNIEQKFVRVDANEKLMTLHTTLQEISGVTLS